MQVLTGDQLDELRLLTSALRAGRPDLLSPSEARRLAELIRLSLTEMDPDNPIHWKD